MMRIDVFKRLPQLFSHLEQYPSSTVAWLIGMVGKVYPQPVFYRLISMKPDLSVSRNVKRMHETATAKRQSPVDPGSDGGGGGEKSLESPTKFAMDALAVFADAESAGGFDSLLDAIFAAISENFAVACRALQEIVRELENLPEHWSEFAVRQLRIILNDCFEAMSDQRDKLLQACVPIETRNDIVEVLEQLSSRYTYKRTSSGF